MPTQNAKQPETPPGLVALRLARQLRKEGHGDEAAWLYRSLDGQPEEAAARLELAQLMQEEGRYGVAVELYDGLERSGRLALRGQLGRLRALRLQHRYADAEASARHLLAGLPDEPDLLFEAGRLALFGENYPLGLARLELATTMSPERPEVLEALIEAQLALGRFPAVAAQLQDLVTSEPLAVHWRELQAQAAEAQGDLEGAIAHWRRVLEIEGHSLPARLAVGRILIETGRWAETVRIYQDLAQTHPGAAEPLVQLAKLAIRQAQPGEALRWLERARALRPEDARLNRDIARAYAEDGQAAAAMRFVRQLCEARPESPDGSITAAAIEELLGAVPRAVTILRRTLRDHSQSFPTAVNLARLLERQGSIRPALQAIESVRELLPECYGAALVRIDLLLELGETARASDALDTLMLDHGGRGDLQKRLARLEVARGQVGLARRRWARTARLDRHVTGPPVNLYRLDRHPIPPALGEIRLFTRLRSQAHRLPAFLAFYRAQGIDRFFIVDNGSDDGTRDYLLAQPDVHLYLTTDAYAEYGGGMRWLNELLVEHGSGSWTLTVDVDELLAYPHAECLDLKALVRHLEAQGAEALFTFMLDMYPAGPVAEAFCAPDASPLTVCPFFDRAGYARHPSPTFPFCIVQGGPMSRILRESRLNGTYLHKVPLIRWASDIRHTASTHHPFPVRLAAETGVLLHFKYLSDLPAKAATESERKQYSQGGKRYTALSGLFARDEGLTLVSELSERLSGTRQLVELGHMRSSAALDALAAAQGGERLRGWTALAPEAHPEG